VLRTAADRATKNSSIQSTRGGEALQQICSLNSSADRETAAAATTPTLHNGELMSK
jgi:hypothetical protein